MGKDPRHSRSLGPQSGGQVGAWPAEQEPPPGRTPLPAQLEGETQPQLKGKHPGAKGQRGGGRVGTQGHSQQVARERKAHSGRTLGSYAQLVSN